ncbi:hypothetical protein PFNF54_01642 [Plasmodium falciparum NF54]|uniref:Erythrocyte membrane protein 1 n=1 Tax=Plasmodium falciparum (isolate NF54) TaxID=5843 RepID=W7KJ57_PLAFO|nr:hypothetical protein PFNF54_01642 [Plasmodium falciparum NF54]
MAQGGRGGQVGGDDYSDAKHLLDSIGKKVHDEIVKKDAKTYIGELAGLLSQASIFGGETVAFSEPCGLIKNESQKLAALGDPCGSASEKRFSKERVDEYDKKKIKCSNSEGACAPYRRLHVCDKNMVKMDTNNDSKAKHDLLLDVCLAAKYEGESLKTYRAQYDEQYPSSVSTFTMCTMLARSFADIGDIVRGRDLYRGNRKKNETKTEREKLDDKLKEIFENIRKENNSKLKSLTDDQIREYWWTANRNDVWKAITCSADKGNTYFRATCIDLNESPSMARDKCRCKDKSFTKETDQVPTYFDYVPQFLRWFEEWAEDFCRKKKKYVDIVKTYCRNETKGKYCSLNGYDCTKTKPAIGRLRMGNQCTKCFFACYPYEKWIDKKKEEFLKQKQKYEKEMEKYTNEASGSTGGRAKRSVSTTNYDGYESKFYKILKDKYKDEGLNKFLEKLSNEDVCTKVDDEGGKIRFEKVNSGGTARSGGTSGTSSTSGDSGTNDINNKTFYRSKYCQPCPLCGMKRTKNGGNKWEEKSGGNCKSGKLYRPKGGKDVTPIRILKSGENHDDIEEKLNAFCQAQNGTGGVANGSGSGTSDSQKLYQEWKCYQLEELTKVVQDGVEDEDDEDDEVYDKEVEGAGGLCILKKKKEKSEGKSQNDPDEIQKTFHNFFYYWVAHMLKDSIHWRTKKLDKCLQNGKKKCGKKICNGDCDCFKRWVEQKRKEWDPIKKQFSKQKGIPFGCYFTTLEGVLQLEFLNENTDEDAENNVSAEEAKEIQHLRQMLKQAGVAIGLDALGGCGTGGDSDNEKETLMDKFLEEEEQFAEKCIKKCQETQKQPTGDGVADTSPDPSRDTNVDPEQEEEEEEDDSEEQDATVNGPEDGGGEATQQPQGPSEKKEEVKVCETVKTALGGNLDEACNQKYGLPQRHWGWKCIPSGSGSTATREGEGSSDGGAKDGVGVNGGVLQRARRGTPGEKTATSSDSGAICVPPRRRRLYVTPLTRLAGGDKDTQASVSPQVVGETPQVSTPALTSPPPSDPRADVDLVKAFVESAAVETFFLWDRYKKEWEHRNKKPQDGLLLFGESTASDHMAALSHTGGPQQQPGSVSDDPQSKLQKSGEIPTDFLRQMFYTLGDYRDICIGGDRDIVGDTIVSNTEGGTPTKISEKIEQILSKQSGTHPPTPPGPPQTSVEKTTRESWWNAHAPSIWKGMICALTYKDGEEGKSPQVDTTVQKELLDKDGKPLNPQYQYTNAKLEEKNSGAKQNRNPTAPSDNKPTTLVDFISRPPYFRYLEEWGENFCKERKKRLKQIKVECKVDQDNDKNGKKCSGYGEDCHDNVFNNNYTTFPDFYCPDCGKYCSSYRKWIERKGKEFIKQKNAYKEQKTNFQTQSETAKEFLQKLGSCKNNNRNENAEDNNKIFEDNGDTFEPAKDCKPCSQFRVKSEKCNCRSSGKGNTCNDKNSIDVNDIGDGGNSTVLEMRVSDDSKSGSGFDGLGECKEAHIFKGIRKDVWTCEKVCGYNVCKPIKVDGKENGENQIIIIRALFKRWLEYFLEDYNKIRKKLKPCKKNGEGSPCIKDCDKICECVTKWIEKKRTEWTNIKKHYLEKKHEKGDDGMTSLVKNFLEDLQDRPEFQNAIKPCNDLNAFEKSCGLHGAEISQKKEGEDYDLVLCLLKKLEEKAKKCKEDHSSGEQTEKECQEYPPLPDEEYENEDENEKTNIQPKFCPKQQTPPKQEDEDGCVPAEAPKEVVPEKKVPSDPPPAPAPAAPPSTPAAPKHPRGGEEKKAKPSLPNPPTVFDNPHVKTALVTSTLAWSVGIGFAAFTYFYLKKKTKSPVDLLRVLDIHKGDYDIPTKLSPNRYIPYTSGKYRGKRYIYLEGDSGTDSGYTDHYSDITSSSESEYEELDINDIYVPGSPKYKTLIEVVLEPSGNNTTASGKNTTASGKTQSGNNTTASGKNTPSDTQNDIQNDGIPSNKFSDNEWNTLKDDFISNMLQNEPNTEPNILDYNLDNNTHPTMSRDNMEEKPFITSIHDRNLYTGEEYNYNVNMSTNNVDIPMSDKNGNYTGIDLINDTLSGNHNVDIYDELLKRKENELFGTNNPKRTSTYSVAKNTNSDPILNQINLFHTWLDRHRDMCEQWDTNNKKEELLDKLKEEWENETHSGNTHPSDSNKTLNTDVSIQIHMDDPKTTNEFTYVDSNPNQVDDTYVDTYPNNSSMDTILEDLEKYKEPYYDVQDDIYYDVNDDNDISTVDSNNMDIPSKVQIEMDVNTKLVKEKYPIADVWDI